MNTEQETTVYVDWNVKISMIYAKHLFFMNDSIEKCLLFQNKSDKTLNMTNCAMHNIKKKFGLFVFMRELNLNDDKQNR